MRGTGYAIAEIVWWLVAAAIIGFLIGWLIRTWSMRNAVDAEWQERVDAEKKRVKNLETDLATRISATYELEADLVATKKRLAGLERDFAEKVEELRVANQRTEQLVSEPDPPDGLDGAGVSTEPSGTDVAE
jgi:hypothetical protein